MFKELDTNFSMPRSETNWMRGHIAQLLEGTSPDKDPAEFYRRMYDYAKHGPIPLTFRDGVEDIRRLKQSAVVIRGVPTNRPGIDCTPYTNDNPTAQRWQRESHITEGTLALYAILRDRQLITYRTVNQDADRMQQGQHVFFHDIFPQIGLYGTQSSRTNGEVVYHQDLAGKRHCPDNVPIAGEDVQSCSKVWTVYLPTENIRKHLSPKHTKGLEQERFFTPNDVLVTDGDPNLAIEPPHSILSHNSKDMCMFDGRTRPIDPNDHEAQVAIDALMDVARNDDLAYGNIIEPSMLQAMNNHEGIHKKEPLDTPMECLLYRHLVKSFEVQQPTVDRLNNMGLIMAHYGPAMHVIDR